MASRCERELGERLWKFLRRAISIGAHVAEGPREVVRLGRSIRPATEKAAPEVPQLAERLARGPRQLAVAVMSPALAQTVAA